MTRPTKAQRFQHLRILWDWQDRQHGAWTVNRGAKPRLPQETA